jgi:3,4-dihydroxy 2-butanone 4-phosphate synthase/GTP cyclohydrolase II
VVGLEGYNLKVTDRVPLQVTPNKHNARYLETKRDKLGHLIDNSDLMDLKGCK